MDGAEVLRGGFVAEVVRIGNTVRRTATARTPFVHKLLLLFEERDWPGAPRFLGIDDHRRETLTFLDGHVAWAQTGQPPSVRSEASLVAVARLVRQFHDLTAGTDLADGHEVVCHNDLSPKNTVYRDDGDGYRPYAFIDWDLAAPGERVHDVALMCAEYLALGPAVADVAEAARLTRVLADAYGLADRSTLVDAILWWRDRCWRGIEAEAAAGVPHAVLLRDRGAADAVRAGFEWTRTHRAAFDRALRAA